jgi:hypothetical protein
MAISASQVGTGNTLEQFRVQFNNLQTDVSGLESGTTSYTALSATTISVSELTVTSSLTSTSFILEGDTDDDFETTLTTIDPTADRTVSLPNETGTLISTGTTANTLITEQTSISSGDVVSGSDELLISDASATAFKRVTVDNLISSAGGLTSVAADSTPQLGGDLDVNGQDIVSTSNANIDIVPNGTGDVTLQTDSVQVGDSNANATITTNGTGDLILNTNSGSNSGVVTIEDAANGNILLAPNGSGVVRIDGTSGIDIESGSISVKNSGAVSNIKLYCESSNAHYTQIQSTAHANYSGNVTITMPAASGTVIATGNSDTPTTSTSSSDIDHLLFNDGGTLKKITIGNSGLATPALDDIGTGDAASTLTTSAGNITIDAQGDNTDIIFKGTDGTSDTTFLTLDGSEAGKAIFNAGITIADAGTIGSASDADSIAIASDGVVTMNQIPVFSAGINVSGGTIAGTLATAAQGNITSLGTLTALTVDDVAVNGKVITMTGSTDDTAVFTVATNGALTLETTDTAAAAANIQITADGTFEVDGTTITLDSAGDIVLDAAGNNVTMKSGGTAIGDFSNSSSDFVVTASVQDKDIIFKGDDGGSAVTSLTMDMSAAGKSVFGAAAVGSTLTDATNSGSITLDFDTYQNFVLTATGNVTLANPSTESVGQSGLIIFIQDGTGSRTLATGSDFEWPAGTAGTISTSANAVDIIPYFVDASNSILLGAPTLAMATPS